MSKLSKSAGIKWHQTPMGPKPCHAIKKACPYSTHYETEEDAFDTRRRSVNANNEYSYNLPFNVKIAIAQDVEVSNGGEDVIDASDKAVSLREMSDYAKDIYVRTGQKPHLTTGVMTLDLADSRRLVIKREVFGVADRPSARYHLTYWSNENQYEIHTVTLDEKQAKDSYESLQSIIQQYMEEANQEAQQKIHDEAVRKSWDATQEEAAKQQYAKNLKNAYEKTIQTLDQIEILSRGGEKVSDFYSIDLFSKENPGTLTLSADVGQSVFQPQDVVESLRIHATRDSKAQNISIHVSEELPNNEGSWALSRIPEGNWYFSYAVGKENFTHEISHADAQNASEVVAEVLQEKHMSREMVASRAAFVKAMVSEVEPAVQNYMQTVATRDSKSPTRPKAPEKNMREKLYGIFS